MAEQTTEPEVTLSITLPNYDHKLQYLIRREPDRLVIEPVFDYKDEESRYILRHLLSEKHLAKQANKWVRLPLPRSLQEREELVALTLEEQMVPIEFKPEERQAAIDSLHQKRRELISHIIRKECQPLANLTPEGRQIFASLSLEERQVFAGFFLEIMEELCPSAPFWRTGSLPRPHWPNEVEAVVFGALNVFGVDAMRLCAADEWIVRRQSDSLFLASLASGRAPVPPPTHTVQGDTYIITSRASTGQKALTYDALASLDRLGRAIGEVIRDWQRIVRDGNLEERHRAQKNLSRVCQLALIPPTRGKRKKRVGVSDLEVEKRYYGALFRCEQAFALLKKAQGRIRGKLTLEVVCKACNLPADPKEWGMTSPKFDTPDHLLRNLQLWPATENAGILTAAHFDVKLQTVRNIVSR